ncbi:Polar-differentiation response regulator DivK [Saliniradius amylolyticus]|uniref:Polar-differentiation response regulator DivK n=1 Tax=Saliniradius amylolyticus TaxID=2183582 RepID=A0A2S2E541_9ALTE|nr:response regulator [Saliniradius amylolyticus]AWL12107.1 Polar-differentiation response regulator DivK [Saliniradius amylolyticus]
MSKSLLIVDDSPSVRQMVEATLKSANYKVKAAKDGQEGLNLAKSEQFDFVLTDQNMPNMDGLTLIKSLRGLPAYTRTPIIVLTTEASDEMKTQGRAAGATGWMVKPFDPSKLLAVVAKVLN